MAAGGVTGGVGLLAGAVAGVGAPVPNEDHTCRPIRITFATNDGSGGGGGGDGGGVVKVVGGAAAGAVARRGHCCIAPTWPSL